MNRQISTSTLRGTIRVSPTRVAIGQNIEIYVTIQNTSGGDVHLADVSTFEAIVRSPRAPSAPDMYAMTTQLYWEPRQRRSVLRDGQSITLAGLLHSQWMETTRWPAQPGDYLITSEIAIPTTVSGAAESKRSTQVIKLDPVGIKVSDAIGIDRDALVDIGEAIGALKGVNPADFPFAQASEYCRLASAHSRSAYGDDFSACAMRCALQLLSNLDEGNDTPIAIKECLRAAGLQCVRAPLPYCIELIDWDQMSARGRGLEMTARFGVADLALAVHQRIETAHDRNGESTGDQCDRMLREAMVALARRDSAGVQKHLKSLLGVGYRRDFYNRLAQGLEIECRRSIESK